MNRFKTAAFVSVLAIELLGSGACLAQTDITMWTFLDPKGRGGREQALASIIEKFERANPGLHVKVEPQVPSTMAEKFALAHGSRNAPDIAWVNPEAMAPVFDSGAAADLDPILVRDWPAARKADYMSAKILDVAVVNGKRLAMPIMPNTWVLMYRKDLLRQAGLTPENLRTWDGVTAAAKKLTRTGVAGQQDIWGIGLGISQDRFSATPAVLAAVGAQGKLFDDQCHPKLATPEIARAVQMEAGWIAADRVTPREAVSLSSDDAIDQFASGRYAMEVINISRFEQIQRTAAGWNADELGVAAIPGQSADRPGPAFISGWFAVAWSGSPRLKEAAKFIDALTAPDAMAMWANPGGQVPILKSTAATPEMQAPRFAHLRFAAAMLGDSGLSVSTTCNWYRTMADFNLAAQQVVLGQQSALDALKIAERATQDRQ